MQVLFVLSTFLLLAQSQVPKGVCWVEVGFKAEYGSADQVRDLQRHTKNTSCDLFGLAWRIKPIPDRQSLLLWDAKQRVLFRVHIEGKAASATVRWEKWTGATKEGILADDPSDGFDLASYLEGRGKVGMSSAATGFVRKHAPGRFDAAL
jgi:hypothetical protein